ncbi:MAG: hypothetical protein AB7V62_09710 [Thermoleophilia bacterium]
MSHRSARRGRRLPRPVLAAGLLAPAALAVAPALAGAVPVIAADAICVRPLQSPAGALSSPPLTVTGSGFGPGAQVTLRRGARTLTGNADAAGQFTATLSVLDLLTGRAPKSQPFTVVAEDAGGPGGNPPAQGASNTIKLRAAPLAFTASPKRTRPSARVTFRLSGFEPDRVVYAHYRYGGRVRATVAMGRASNPCGLLTTRRKQIPVANPQSGLWRVQFDHNRRFSAKSTPRIPATIQVFRTLVPR